MRPDPGEALLLVDKFWPGLSFVICVCLVKADIDNKNQITQDCNISNFVTIVITIKQALSYNLQCFMKSCLN